ncbi:MAG: type II toxin-antitoxin system RelE/ParE family toxin [Bacteroidales bacterium]|jgi:plasmid stabilization system protein ParE|nr:type II toxin-antitoxin system RelE/ParE family toxin [Bacteroidales bacterium]
MEKEFSRKPYITSEEFEKSRAQIYDYSLKTFGFLQAERYWTKIQKSLDMLPYRYLVHPECRHIPTKSQMYRNIVLDSHLIIYQITDLRVEVLDIVPSASSVSKIRGARRVCV